jgi:hypothetical protein
MVEFLAQIPQLQFTLALVELQIYELDTNQDKSLLIIPQIVTRTREVIRAVVKIEAREIGSIKVDIDDKFPTDPEKIFFDNLSKAVNSELGTFTRSIIEDMENLDCRIEWGRTLKVKLPDPRGSGQNFSLFYIYKDGLMNSGSLAFQLAKLGISEQIGLDFVEKIASLFNSKISKDPTVLSRYIRLSELRQQYVSFRLLVRETIDKIKDAANSK